MNTITNQLDSIEQVLLDQLELEFKYSRNILDDKIWALVTSDLTSKFDTEQEAKAFLITVLKNPRGSNIQAFIASIRSFGFSLEDSINLIEKYSESGIYEYLYLFKNGEWYICSIQNSEFIKLTNEIIDTNKIR